MKRIQAAYLRPPVTQQQGKAYLAEMPALEVRTSRYQGNQLQGAAAKKQRQKAEPYGQGLLRDRRKAAE